MEEKLHLERLRVSMAPHPNFFQSFWKRQLGWQDQLWKSLGASLPIMVVAINIAFAQQLRR
jgi:hypothetical protein